MRIRLVSRDPDKGYLGRQLWLPRKHINVPAVKSGLEFPVMGDDGIDWLQLWKDSGEHIIVPREFVRRERYEHLAFPVVDMGPTKYPRVDFKSNVALDYKTPDKDDQRRAFEAMKKTHGGILNLACGKGKTVLALHHAAHRKVPAMVIVNNTTLMEQWPERINQFLHVPGGIGFVQGHPSKWDWEGRGIVIAMINSLALRHEEIPEGMDRYFGSIYYDEVHHLAAPLFSHTAPMFFGARFGLTATVSREDGLEPVYKYHIGDVFHRDLSQELKPRIYVQEAPVQVRTSDKEVSKEVFDKAGRLCIPKLRSYLGKLEENNEFIAEKLRVPLRSGRKVLALSHSVDQLRALSAMFPGSGLCTGREKPAARIETLKKCPIAFGTLQLVKEALDEDTLDTMFFLTPFGSSEIDEGGMGTMQQGMGRILRVRPGKKTPVMVIIDHIHVPSFHKMVRQMKNLLRHWPTEQGGPLEYTIIRPYATTGDTE